MLTQIKGSSAQQQLDGWDALYLEYKIEWPMGLLLTPGVMARYNTLFQFLMRLKRVQLKLEGAWQSLHSMSTHKGAAAVAALRAPGGTAVAQGDEAAAAAVARSRELQHVRHQMSHLVTNLQIYIQV